MNNYQDDDFVPARLDLKKPTDELSIRTAPELVDYNAVTNPDALFCLQAVKNETTMTTTTTTPHQSFDVVPMTMRRLRDAIIRCQDHLTESGLILKCPHHTADGKLIKSEPVALFMDSDLNLFIHLMALMGFGVPVLLLSVRLSQVSVKHLMETVGVRRVIASSWLLNKLKPVAQAVPETELDVAKTFTDLAEGREVASLERVGRRGHFVDDFDRNVLIFHSSGTTGLPKPIPQPHKYMLTFSTCHIRTEAEDVRGLNMSTLPLYHGFGMLAPMLALAIGKPLYLPPARTVPTGASVIAALRATPRTKSLMTVPHILEELVSLPEEEWREVLRPLQFVACGGGPLKLVVGEKLAKAGVRLLSHFGATEIGPMAPIFVPGPDYDWHFWRLRDDFHLRVEPIRDDDDDDDDDDDRQDSKGETTTTSYFQVIARPYGWTEDYVLQDWLIKKPESSDSSSSSSSNSNSNSDSRRSNGPKDGIYLRAVGRRDDVIVLATGEKVLPRILENMLEESPAVKAAVAFGESQFELGVIVEPATYPEDIDGFKKSILWPIVVDAGRQMDSHAKISGLDSIIVAAEAQKLPRTDKGIVSRKEAQQLFAAEIRRAYELMETNTASSNGTFRLEGEDLEGSLRKLVEMELEENIGGDGCCGVDDDLFELGMNSLQCVHIYRTVANAVRLAAERGDASLKMPSKDFVHRYPTISRMATALRAGEAKTDTGTDTDTKTGNGIHQDAIEDYVKRYRLPRSTHGFVVLLTGSSGSLGSHTLSHLVGLPQVAKVICLQRKGARSDEVGDPVEALLEKATQKGATIPPSYKQKVSVMTAQPFKHHLGLSDELYALLCDSVTHILHAAWPMGFKRALGSFESQFAFLQNLLQLARDVHFTRPALRPRVVFISSISTVGRYPQCHDGERFVPEEMIDGGQESTSELSGYGQAKLVCEKIMANAAAMAKSEMEVSCIRLGQIAGASTNGFWNAKEHIPVLMSIAQRMGRWPKLQGTLSWLPVDTCAAVISDIALSPAALDLVYHVENPVRQDWPTVIWNAMSELNCTESPLVDLDDWCAQMQIDTSETAATEIEQLLADFFRDDFQHMACGGVILDTRNARRMSSTLRRAVPVDDGLVRAYVREWKRVGVLKME
ncbi:hypothetical protein GGR50DRAFT_673698 [Xylaria sp. CBS 124048]|nr:hypothetical protein GGR50DRAFT_673698 [Xylaria sp. CBS 124048]